MSTEKVTEKSDDGTQSRRRFVKAILRGVAFVALGGWVATLLSRAGREGLVWQIDPSKCIQCGRCETNCVLETSAVKCVHEFPICGFCERCFAYYDPSAKNFETGAENQLCPVGALSRKLVEEPYYEYKVDGELCVACGRCVKGCDQFGNGSLYLQVQHDRCMNCNECSIAVNCPSKAFVRVPAGQPYLGKNKAK